jgi:hypothetical protein
MTELTDYDLIQLKINGLERLDDNLDAIEDGTERQARTTLVRTGPKDIEHPT